MLLVSFYFLCPKSNKKACRHNAPWFSGLRIGKIAGWSLCLALGWLLDSPLIFAWFSGLRYGWICLMILINLLKGT